MASPPGPAAACPPAQLARRSGDGWRGSSRGGSPGAGGRSRSERSCSLGTAPAPLWVRGARPPWERAGPELRPHPGRWGREVDGDGDEPRRLRRAERPLRQEAAVGSGASPGAAFPVTDTPAPDGAFAVGAPRTPAQRVRPRPRCTDPVPAAPLSNERPGWPAFRRKLSARGWLVSAGPAPAAPAPRAGRAWSCLAPPPPP